MTKLGQIFFVIVDQTLTYYKIEARSISYDTQKSTIDRIKRKNKAYARNLCVCSVPCTAVHPPSPIFVHTQDKTLPPKPKTQDTHTDTDGHRQCRSIGDCLTNEVKSCFLVALQSFHRQRIKWPRSLLQSQTHIPLSILKA